MITLESSSDFSSAARIEGEQKIPALWPGGSLAQFGKTPSGKNIWRVVWSESVNHLFGARWMDVGFIGYRYIPSYMNKKCYVLEKFLTPYQFDKCTEEMWNRRHKDPDTGLAQLGPYPANGTYYGPFWEFNGYPTLGAVESIIGILTRCDEIPEAEKHAMMVKARETEKILEVQKAKEIILDSLPLSMTSGKLTDRFYRDAENIPQRLSAQDLSKLTGLPLGEGKAFTSGAKRIPTYAEHSR